jgi:hypothetical protein
MEFEGKVTRKLKEKHREFFTRVNYLVPKFDNGEHFKANHETIGHHLENVNPLFGLPSIFWQQKMGRPKKDSIFCYQKIFLEGNHSESFLKHHFL